MSITKQIPKIVDAFHKGSADKRAGKPSQAKRMPKSKRKAYANGYRLTGYP